MSRLLLALALSLAAVAAATPAAAKPAKKPASSAARFVLVRGDARLLREPRADAPALQLLPSADLLPWHVYRLVDLGRDFVELESPGDGYLSDHCVSGPAGLVGLRLRLFVARGDLAPVTTRTIAKVFADGSAVTVPPGAPVMVSDGTRLTLRDRAIDLGRHPGSFGDAYAPAPLPRRPVERWLTVSGTVGTTRWDDDDARVLAVRTGPRGASLVDVEQGCARATVRVTSPIPPPDEDDGMEGGVAGGILGGLASDVPSVDADAAVYFADGSRAGVVSWRLFLVRDLVTRSGDRVCTRRRLDDGTFRTPDADRSPSGPLTLCFDAADVKHLDAPAPDPIIGTPAPSAPSRPQNVAPSALEQQRISGDQRILPDGRTRKQLVASGTTKVITIAKMCVDTAGKVTSVTFLKSSGFPAYDARIADGVKQWRYRPFVMAGKPTSVCSAVTFMYSTKDGGTQ